MKIPKLKYSFLGKYKNNFLLLLSSIFFGALGQLLMKAGANKAEIQNLFDLVITMVNPLVIVGLISYSLSSGIWLIILTRLPLSIAYPFGAVSYIFVIIASALSGEYINPIRYLGVTLIAAGILIIGNAKYDSKS